MSANAWLAGGDRERMGSDAATVIWIGRSWLRTYLAPPAPRRLCFGGRGSGTRPLAVAHHRTELVRRTSSIPDAAS